MPLVAVRLIDLAIFGSLGALWIGGAVFIVVLYRWLFRFEREQEPTDADAIPASTSEPEVPAEPARARVIPQTATARDAVVAST